MGQAIIEMAYFSLTLATENIQKMIIWTEWNVEQVYVLMSQTTSWAPLAYTHVQDVTEQPVKNASNILTTYFSSKQEQSDPLAAPAFVPLLVVTSPDGGGRWIEEGELPACVLFVAVARLYKIPL